MIRKDIQTLRGVALLFVIAYHARLGLNGGFVGVDMFFVVSGFVITNQLLENNKDAPLQLVYKFIVRRFWRLVPVLFGGVFLTLTLSLIVLSPFGDQGSALATGWSAIAFLSNVELMLNSVYWSSPNNPLLHTWSLGVEGQFYLGILILVTTLIFFDRRAIEARRTNHLRGLPFVIVTAICASFVLSLLASYDLSFLPIGKNLAFYSSPTRAWEFLFGGFLASQQTHLLLLSKRSVNYLGVFGWFGILAGLVVIRPTSVFPGWVALFPVLGTTAIIASGGAGHKFSQVFNLRVFRHVGDISYSWYVVHYPVLSLLTVLFPISSVPQRIVWVGFSYLLGLVVFLKIEKPMRGLSLAGWGRQLKVGSLMVAVSLSLMLAIGWGSAVLRSSWEPRPFYTGFRDAEVIGECLDAPVPHDMSVPDDMSETCVWNRGAGRPRLMLLGDSQAESLATGAIHAAELVGSEIAVHSQGGCQFVSPSINQRRCPSWDDRWRAIREYKPDVLIVSNAWSYNSPRYINDLAEAVRSEKLLTIFVHEAPSLGKSYDSLANKLLTPPPMLANRDASDASLKVLNQVADLNTWINVFDPETTLCPKIRCSLEMPELRGMFWSDSHLSMNGSNVLTPNLAKLISIVLNK